MKKDFGQKNFWEDIILLKKILVKKLLVQKKLVQKNVGPIKILVQKKIWSEINFVKKNFGQKKV